MRIGYPCINKTLDCSASSTFRLKSYSEARLKISISNNLDCLRRILQFNLEHKLFFFRISSDLVPFASHPINKFNWQKTFQNGFEGIGEFVIKNRMRISMHPDQFTLINSIKDEIFERSKKELQYHAEILDFMKLDTSAKIQIHVGGAYGDKKASIKRFVKRFCKLPDSVTRRLVVENDDKLFDLSDCLQLSEEIQIPILFDIFHHKLNNSTTKTMKASLKLATKSWNKKRDGVPMVDYSSQEPNGLPHQHSETINLEDFDKFLKQTQPFNFDVMLEIKDKEKSAIKAIEYAVKDWRLREFF
ncbi:MAG: UV DNA damage repair endonuclease UvsE [Candidatus Bathyarchaeota archaeon]|nr:UV DNA damage repair endonuclease UvsE [Candidatus Bathyarchaeota archaeon]